MNAPTPPEILDDAPDGSDNADPFASVPACLRGRAQWVCWRYAVRRGKRTKVPFDAATGREASSTDPDTWVPFEEAVAAWRASQSTRRPYAGVGYVFAADDPYAGVDLDDCVDPETGEIKSWGRALLLRLDSYAEVSPSLTGVKVVVEAAKTGPRCRAKYHDGRVEVYDRKRFFTVTGRRLADFPADVMPRQEELAEVYEEVFGQAADAEDTATFAAAGVDDGPEDEPVPPSGGDEDVTAADDDDDDASNAGTAAPVALTDDQIIEKALRSKSKDKVADLWAGRWAERYDSQSEADSALIFLLAFYTKDPGQLDRLFRLSGLMRDKWDELHGERTYGRMTIDNALAKVTAQWTPLEPATASSGDGGDDANDAVDEDLGDAVNAGGAQDATGLPPAPPADDPAAAAAYLARVGRLRTDVGNAARFVLRHGKDVRFCHPWGKWLRWTGTRWQVDDRGHLPKLAKRTALSIYTEAAAEPDDGRRALLVKWAERSQARDRVAAMLELAKAELAVTPDELDADPWLLNCRNGTVDLRTGTLRPHRRADLLTKQCRAGYAPAARAPAFGAFLARIFRTHPTLVEYCQRALGYGCTGLTTEQVLFFLYGTGANGKTTLLDAAMYALGDYAGKADRDLLAAHDHPSHPTNVADLMGRRLVVCSETNDGGRFDEAKLKDLVGETVMKARFMRQDLFEFTATHKVFLYSNHKPLVRGTDHGFWRRMRVIPFVERIADDEKDTALPEKLRAEADGILAWLVAGCLRWRAEGLGMPDAVAQATDGYRVEMDSIGAFIQEAGVLGERLRATARDLYAAYVAWCEDNGERALSQKRFGTALSERGLTNERDTCTGRKVWLGIGLRATAPGE